MIRAQCEPVPVAQSWLCWKRTSPTFETHLSSMLIPYSPLSQRVRVNYNNSPIQIYPNKSIFGSFPVVLNHIKCEIGWGRFNFLKLNPLHLDPVNQRRVPCDPPGDVVNASTPGISELQSNRTRYFNMFLSPEHSENSSNFLWLLLVTQSDQQFTSWYDRSTRSICIIHEGRLAG